MCISNRLRDRMSCHVMSVYHPRIFVKVKRRIHVLSIFCFLPPLQSHHRYGILRTWTPDKAVVERGYVSQYRREWITEII